MIRRRSSLRFFGILSVVIAATMSTAIPSGLAEEPYMEDPCASFVHLEDGKFYAGNTPFAMEGPNLLMAIAKVPYGPAEPAEDPFFIAPHQLFQADNYAVCNGTSNNGCCDSRTTCRSALQADIDALVDMGANSVRLIVPRMEWDETDKTHHTPTLACSTLGSTDPCTIDLMDPYERDQALKRIEDQINALGDNGIRSILLTGRPNGGHLSAEYEYGRWLDDLATRLKNNPYLIAYDPMNEPPYLYNAPHLNTSSCANAPSMYLCKDMARAVSKGWFDHLTLNDPNHLVSIGLGDSNSVFWWDPAVLWDHFTSYHMYPYPGGPWEDPGSGGPIGGVPFPQAPAVSGAKAFSDGIYYGSLNACGEPCPYVGEFDSRNCYVAAGPVGKAGIIDNATGGFNYSPFTGPSCPIGSLVGGACQVATFEPGRDQPFVLDQPLYYVIASAGNPVCPPGTTWDTANCLAHVGPPQAQAFIGPNPSGGGQGFFYHHLNSSVHCHAPATDTGTACYLGPVPSGWTPFTLERPLYYVEPVTCDRKKPVYYGETGFSTYPYPTGAHDQTQGVPQGQVNVCADEETGPVIDWVQIGNVQFEADVNHSGTTLPTLPGATNGTNVHTIPGSQIDILFGAGFEKCETVTIRYRSIREKRLWMTIEGHAPRRLTLPNSQGVWGTFQGTFNFPPGASVLTLTSPHDAANGDYAEQEQFMMGDGAGWRGVYPYSRACGYQGLHYWLYGPTTHWGGCGITALNAFSYQVDTSPGLPDRLLTPAAEVLRDQVDFLSSPIGKCDKPDLFNEALSRSTGPSPTFMYSGTIVDSQNQPIPNAAVLATVIECSSWENRVGIGTHADAQGHYVFQTDAPIALIQASHFGYQSNHLWPNGSPALPDIELEKIPNLTPPTPPTPPAMACRGDSGWITQ